MFSLYYDLSKILSYNAFLNFLLGERGVGKTYSCSKFVTKKFINSGDEFVYIRRYKSDLKKSVPKFFNALITNNEFEEHKLRTHGDLFYIDDKVAGYGMTLTMAQSLKSSNFPNVKYIIFDEFIIENDGHKHYLQGEVEVFLGLVETIARMRDVKIFMLGNAVTVTNPYFIFFDISMPYNTDIKTYKDGLILVQYMKNDEYRKAKHESKLGKLVEGTEYSSYAIDNSFRLDNKDFIEKKSGTSRCAFAFKYKDNIYGAWFDYNIGKIFISNDYLENVQFFACTLEDHKPNTMLINSAKYYSAFKTFVQNYKLGNVYYESQKIKAQVREFIKMVI